MSWGADYDFWDTPIGIAQDLISKAIIDKKIERRFENGANKGE